MLEDINVEAIKYTAIIAGAGAVLYSAVITGQYIKRIAEDVSAIRKKLEKSDLEKEVNDS